MSTPLTDSIQNLIDYINEVTGGQDTNLSDAVATLADGYGGYSIDDIVSRTEPSGDFVINSPLIGQYMFIGNKNIQSVRIIGNSIIGASAFNTSSITELYGPLITSIGVQAFMGCGSLTKVYLPTITAIVTSVFAGCRSLTDIHIPNVNTLNARSFQECISLKKIYLPSCTKLDPITFYASSALTDIYLPNNESTYTGAPWGATNATIHYNTQFDENGEPILE